jgi:hypothetical protein
MRALRYLWIPLFSLALMAQTGTTGSTTQTKTRRRAATSTSTRKKSTAAGPTTAEEIKSLREALAVQQQQIQQLTQQLQQRDQNSQQQQQQINQLQQAASEAQNKAVSAENTSTQTAESFTKLQSDVADIKTNATNSAVSGQEDQKRITAIEGLLSRFRWTGDVRVRYDGIFQTYAGCVGTNCADRNRPRFRLRLGLEGKINEDFYGGAFLGSGANVNAVATFSDPTSLNETFNTFFERKAIGVDRAWITYQPQAHKWLQMTGGKFAYTWQRTQLTFKNDLNPEGFVAKTSFDFSNPVFKNVNAQGMVLFFNEVAKGVDSNAPGGQISGRLQFFGNEWTMVPSYTALNWNGADSIAQAEFPVPVCAKPTSVNCLPEPLTTAVGTPINQPLVPPVQTLNPGPFTNASFIKGAGTGQTRAFVSGFFYNDFILDNTFLTPWSRFPWRVLGEYEHNTRARLNVGLAPSKQDNAYWFETSLGQLKNRNDVLIGYSFDRIEQDAVIAPFNDNDQRAPTNIVQHKFYFNWLVRNNTTATFTWYTGRTLNRNLQNAALATGLPATLRDPWLNRVQLDLLYKF